MNKDNEFSLIQPFKNKFYLLLWLFILLLAIVLRFWHLNDIAGPVFDEIYFPKYGYDYLTNKQFFHVHPPLVNYILAASIWIYYHFPGISSVDFSQLQFEQISALSYRWINALMGIFLVMVCWATAYALSKKKWFAILVFFLIAIDGSLLVDSRFGLNNIYLILFGFAALFFAAKIQYNNTNKSICLALCGIFIGLTISVKWNGLGYLLMLSSFILLIKIVHIFDIFRPVRILSSSISSYQNWPKNIYYYEFIFYLIIIPIIIYCLLWIPDRFFNAEYSFVEIHQQILNYHQNAVTANEHPYCSKWYTWPFMIRPIGYSFSSESIINTLGQKIIYYKDVHLFPNPIISWLSALAILIMIFHWITLSYRWFTQGKYNQAFAICTILLLGYFANLLPWAFVSRCVFLYHYQSAATFGIFALGWYLHMGITAKNKLLKALIIILMLLIITAFIYWLPLQLGISIEAKSFYNRMWFSSWI